jgi:hypothetical protein
MNLTDKAAAGLAPGDEDSTPLIDQLVDPANIRKGCARIKGKIEADLPASLKKMSQLESYLGISNGMANH